MITVVYVFLVILLAAASVLCVYLISTLTELKKTLAALRVTIQDITNRVNPILSNVGTVTDKAALLTLEIEEQINSIKNLVINTKEKIGNIFDSDGYEKKNGEHTGPAWFRKVSGIYKGIFAFLNALKT
jgi:predicted PurR-regulated permease PerM